MVKQRNSNQQTKKFKEKHPLLNPKQALIYSQILFSPEPIVAKEISDKTKLPLNTVYHHLKLLKSNNVIESNKKIKGNLVEESWYISQEFFKSQRKDRDENSVLNKNDLGSLFTDPTLFVHSLNFLQAAVKVQIQEYENGETNFPTFQETSKYPAILKLWSVTEEEYQYVIREFAKIRNFLRESAKNRSSELLSDTQFVTKYEKHILFLGGFPSLP